MFFNFVFELNMTLTTNLILEVRGEMCARETL